MKHSSYRGNHKGSTLKARGKIALSRTLNIALVFVLVVGLAPSLSFAGSTNRTGFLDTSDIPQDASPAQASEPPADGVDSGDELGDDDGAADEGAGASDADDVRDGEDVEGSDDDESPTDADAEDAEDLDGEQAEQLSAGLRADDEGEALEAGADDELAADEPQASSEQEKTVLSLMERAIALKNAALKRAGLAPQDEEGEPNLTVTVPTADGTIDVRTSAEGNAISVPFYKAAPTFTIEVSDTSFDSADKVKAAVVVKGKNTAGTETSYNDWKQDGESDSTKWKLDVEAFGTETGTDDVVTLNSLTVAPASESSFSLKWKEDETVKTGSFSYEFGIDQTAPKIKSITVAASDGSSSVDISSVPYFGTESVTATVVVEEAHLDTSQIQFGVSDGFTVSNASWGSYDTANKTTTATLTISGTGACELVVTGSDKAGNPVDTAGDANKKKFGTDTDTPTLTLKELRTKETSVDPQYKVEDGKTFYLTKPLVAVVELKDANPDTSSASFEVPADFTATSSWGTYDSDTKTVTATVEISGPDGPCSLKITAKDLLGKEASAIEKSDFALDTTVPALAFSEAKSAIVKGDSTTFLVGDRVTATITEANFKDANITVAVKKTKDESNSEITSPVTTTYTGDQLTWDNPTGTITHSTNIILGADATDETLKSPGTYEITVTGTDIVGKDIPESGNTQTVVIQKYVGPSLTVTYAPEKHQTYGTGAAAADYFNAATVATLTVTCEDSSFAQTDLTNITLNGATLSASAGWSETSENSGTWTASTKPISANTTLTVSDTAWPLVGEQVDAKTHEYMRKLVIDTDKPKLDVTYSSAKKTAEVAGSTVARYEGNSVVATITVRDANFDVVTYPALATITPTKVSGPDSATATISKQWTQTATGEYEAQVTFSGDAKFQLDVTGADMAGNPFEAYKSSTNTDLGSELANGAYHAEFFVDSADPDLKVAYEGNEITSGSGFYNARTATATLTEANFDPALVSIVVKDLTTNTEATVDSAKWTTPDTTKPNERIATIAFAATGDFTSEHAYQIIIEGTDQTGRALNMSEAPTAPDAFASNAYTGGSFTLDFKAPEITVTVPEPAPAASGDDAPFYNTAATFTVRVKDVHFDATKILVNGAALVADKWTQEGEDHSTTVTYGGDDEAYKADGPYTLTVSGTDAAGRSLTRSTSVPEADFNATTGYAHKFTLDTTKPKISSITVNSDATANSVDDVQFYNNADVTVTIAFEEANFTKKEIIIGGWDGKDNAVVIDDTTKTATVTLKADGVYHLTVKGADKATNPLDGSVVTGASYSTETGTYTLNAIGVDKVDPQLSVTTTNTPASSEGLVSYYGTNLVYQVSIIEVNFVPANISIDGTPTSASDWADGSAANEHVLTKTYAELYDGGSGKVRQLVVTGTDQAQRKLVGTSGTSVNDGTYTSPSFVVDTTDPVISVSSVPSGFVASTVSVRVEVTDGNFDPTGVRVDNAATTAAQWTKGVVSADGTRTTWIFNKTYGEGAGQSVRVSVTDRAGHTAAYGPSSSFTVDLTDPTLVVNMPAPINGQYYGSAVVVTATIVEANFSWSLINVNAPGSTSRTTSDSGSTHTLTVTYAQDAQGCSLSISGRDQAGRGLVAGNGSTYVSAGSYTSSTFIVDLTNPKVNIAMSQGISRAFNGKDYFRSEPTLSATITVDDVNFDVSSDSTNRAGDRIELSGAPAAAYDVSRWGSGKTYTVTFNPNQSLSAPSDLVVTVYDLAGHSVTYAYGEDDDARGTTVDGAGAPLRGESFILDITAPQIEPTNEATNNIPNNNSAGAYSGSLNNNALLFYRDATTLNITVVDPLGVYEVELMGDDRNYTLETNVATGDRASYTVPVVSLRDGHEFTDAFTLRAVDNAGNARLWKISPAEGTIEEVGDSSNINTPLYDGTVLYPTKLIQDTIAPQVSWSGVTAGQYYNSDQSARLSIAELNFRYIRDYDGDLAVAQMIKQEGNAGRAQTTTVYRANQMNAADALAGNYYYDVPFNTDGHYVLRAQFNDPAGNVGSTAEVAEFTIDKTPPTATITWDNNSVRNGMYYNAGRTATITVTEHNFQASDFTVETTGAIGGWSSNGDTHTCTVSFTTDGRYTLSVSGRDRAGNALTPINEPEFVIDLRAPTIDFSNVEAQTAYNDVIAPVINYHDEANFDSAGMSWTLEGSKHGRQDMAASQGASGNDGTVSFADFTREVEYDDIYTLNAHLTDLAGNEADNAITFSVNRFGSNFIVMDAEDYSENNGYMAEPREVQVQEINVSGALSEQHSVSVTHGLSTENLTQRPSGASTSDGFYIVSGSDNAGWSSYVYHIGSGNFSEDGNYHVVISSTDTATNLNNSASYYDPSKHDVADAEVSFILDTADPIIDGISVADGGTYDAARSNVTFTVTDNIGFDSVKVTVDGQEQTITPEMGGLCTVDLPAKTFAPRTMDIVATDLAGRTAQAVVSGFHFTTDFFELNLPLVIGSVIVVAAAAAGAGVFFVRRRRQ